MRLKFSIILLIVAGTVAAQGYNLKFKITGAENDTIYLANYFGKQLYYKDTAYSDAEGKFAFEGNQALLGGTYAVICPGPVYFDIIVNESEIDLETDTTNFVGNMKVKNSKENTIFFEYIKFIGNQRAQAGPLQEQYKACQEGENADCSELLDQITAIDIAVKDYQKKLVEQYDGTLIAKIINMQVDPEVPKDLIENDSLRYLWGLEHYFDNIDLTDDRLVQSHIFHNKMDYFMNKMLIQNPDTICAVASRLINGVPETSDMFRYLVHTFMNNFNSSKIMGMDKVFVCMGAKYYCTGKAHWMTEEKISEICDRVTELSPTLIGEPAMNLTLLDTTNQVYRSLYAIESDWVLILIWDPHCGHCKEEMPHYIELYNEWKDKGLEVYSINNALDAEEDWKKYIRENDLQWINVHDVQDMRDNPGNYIGPGKSDINSINFRKYYDVFSTPKVFLLDGSDFTIIAKQFSAESLSNILENEYATKYPEFNDANPDGKIDLPEKED